MLADHVEAAFGRQFLAALRHQAHRVRLGRKRDAQHLVGRRHLEIQRLGDFRLQPRHVVVADVAAILAQVRGDAVGAGLDREQRRAHRIGMAAGRARCDGRDVIDIDAETERRMEALQDLIDIGETDVIDESERRLSIDALDPGDDGFGAQLGDNRAEMLEVIDLEIDRQSP